MPRAAFLWSATCLLAVSACTSSNPGVEGHEPPVQADLVSSPAPAAEPWTLEFVYACGGPSLASWAVNWSATIESDGRWMMSSRRLGEGQRQVLRSDDSTRLDAAKVQSLAVALAHGRFDELEGWYDAGQMTDQSTMILTHTDKNGARRVEVRGATLLAERAVHGATTADALAAQRFLLVVTAVLRAIPSPIPEQTDLYSALTQSASWSLKLEYSQLGGPRSGPPRAWAVQIDSEGNCTWGGPDIPSTARPDVSKAELDALHRTLTSARFDELGPEYAGRATHSPTVVITHIEDGQSHRVEVYAPEAYASGAFEASDDPTAGKRFLTVAVALLKAIEYPSEDRILERWEQAVLGK